LNNAVTVLRKREQVGRDEMSSGDVCRGRVQHGSLLLGFGKKLCEIVYRCRQLLRGCDCCARRLLLLLRKASDEALKLNVTLVVKLNVNIGWDGGRQHRKGWREAKRLLHSSHLPLDTGC
jgi:hypothetical protein